MLKGISQSDRDGRWHEKHLKKLAKAKKRRRIGRTFVLETRAQVSRADREFKKAQQRERQTQAPPLLVRWLRSLWKWFTSQKPAIWMRRVAHWYHERQHNE